MSFLPGNRLTHAWLAAAAIFVSAGSLARAAESEWPAYRGPNGDGTVRESVQPWSGEPTELWKIPVGDGFGSFAVAGGKAYLFAKQGEDDEACFCYNVADGKQVWATRVDKTTDNRDGGEGPRTTPAVSDGRVYVYSTYLTLACLDAAGGGVVWTHDIDGEFKGQNKTGGIKQWGNSISPIIEGDNVIVAGGGSGATYLAFDKKTGKLAWKSGDDKITHAAPTPATILGQHQLIFFMQSGLVSIDPQNGHELWRQKFKFSVSTAASPVVGGDVVYCSAGYGVGAGAYRVGHDGGHWSTQKLWETPGDNINHWTTAVYHNGYLYGLYGFKEYKKEPLKCLDLKTGKTMWSQAGFGQGGLILAGDQLLIQGDQGQLVLADAKPDAYHELAKAQPLAGKAWQMPVLAEGKIFTRTSGNGQAVCLEAK